MTPAQNNELMELVMASRRTAETKARDASETNANADTEAFVAVVKWVAVHTNWSSE